MTELAVKDECVKAIFSEERKVQAESEFSDDNWQNNLDLDKTGMVKNMLRNLILILENDENLKSVVFNQLSDGMEIKEAVPWSHPSKFWRDADDAQLISYIDRKYGTFSARNYDIAVAKVTDDRSYHPMGDDVYHCGLSFLATDDFMEVFENREYTRETLSKLTDTHINTIYNIFKNKLVAEQTARKVCGLLGILF
jgi:predicted P-loop ATPase